jgi:hypothetical protein
MTQQTAVEWLKKELEDYGSNSHLSLDWNTFDELCEQAKAMEKEQIIENFMCGSEWLIFPDDTPIDKIAEQYYNETYNK